MTQQISFNATDEEFDIVQAIVERAKTLARDNKQDVDSTTMTMDLIACHANGCPLKLRALLDADDSNFAHDVFGIRRHIDRSTGKLTGCFLPRFAV